MRTKALVSVCLLALGGQVQAGAVPRGMQPPVEIFPLSEVRPGLRGVAWTVLAGTEPDSFGVEILGVVEQTEPGRHLILVRGLGEGMERTGIAAGMSGSPIYVHGRLLGALAFSFIAATEPLGAATPIEEMIGRLSDTFEQSTGSGEARPQAGMGTLSPEPFPLWRAQWIERMAAGNPLLSTPAAADLPAGLEWIETPVFLGGRLARGSSLDLPLWQGLGLEPTPSGTLAIASEQAHEPAGRVRTSEERADSLSPSPALRPGDAFGIDLIGGDMVAAAIGTVTWTDGDRLLGLGHPFFEASPVELPVSRARIHTIIPTRGVSFKVGTPLEEVGSLVGDRGPGVAALLGRQARRIPFTVRITRPGRPQIDYRFEIARNEILTPGLLAIALQSALTGDIHGLGPATLAARLTVRLEDGRTMSRNDLVVTLGPGQSAASLIAPVAYIAGTGLAPFCVSEVSIEIASQPEVLTARVEAIHVPRPRVRPGEEVPVDVVLRHQYGERDVRRVTLRVPEELRGDRVRIMVGSPQAFFEWDQDRAPQKYAPRDFDHLIRLLEEYPSEETLIVRLYGPSRGVVHQGRELESLPLSKWQALRGTTTGGNTAAAGGLILDEKKIPTGEVIQSGQVVELEIVR